MAENFICVTQQILLLAAIILVGFALSKANLISAEGENAISALALYVATPAVVISAFQRPFEAILWMGLKQTALIVILTFAVMVTVTKLTIRHADIGYRSVMRFAAIFANVGFMCLPLVKALYGKTGVFYCSVVVALFNIETWTYGYALMSSVGGGKLPLKKAFLNPGVLSTLVGALLFLTSTSLPAAVDAVVDAFSPLNTPPRHDRYRLPHGPFGSAYRAKKRRCLGFHDREAGGISAVAGAGAAPHRHSWRRRHGGNDYDLCACGKRYYHDGGFLPP